MLLLCPNGCARALYAGVYVRSKVAAVEVGHKIDYFSISYRQDGHAFVLDWLAGLQYADRGPFEHSDAVCFGDTVKARLDLLECVTVVAPELLCARFAVQRSVYLGVADTATFAKHVQQRAVFAFFLKAEQPIYKPSGRGVLSLGACCLALCSAICQFVASS